MTRPNLENIKSKGFSTILIALIGVSVGLLGQVFDWWDVAKQRDDSYIEKYVESQLECNETIRKLEKDFAELNNRFNTLEIASSEIPFPYWIKDRDGKILYVNNAYKETILEPLGIKTYQFINTLGDSLGAEFVDAILANDKRVIIEDRVIAFPERIPDLSSGTSYKFPLHTKFSGTIGTGGIWIPENINN
jgi:hypothetical protein